MEHYDAIIRARAMIKQKFNAMRRGESETVADLEKTFRPVTQPLQAMLRAAKQEPVKDTANIKMESPKEEQDEGTWQDYGPDVNPYIRGMLAPGNNYDYIWGVRPTDDGGLSIGSEEVTFDRDGTLNIRGESFSPSKGLLQLIFMNTPSTYTTEDLQQYKRILKLTNAHRRDNDPTKPIFSNRSVKYREIIRELFRKKGQKTKKHQGSGLFVGSKRRTYVYWDDPNELVERLDLLTSSKQAGHTGHEREILSIIEELRESGYIE